MSSLAAKKTHPFAAESQGRLKVSHYDNLRMSRNARSAVKKGIITMTGSAENEISFT